VIVDNGSADPAAVDLLHALAARPGTAVVRSPGAFNFAHLINTGVAAASAEMVALVNNDLLVIEPGWLKELVSLCALSGVGAAGACLRYPGGGLQHGGIVTGLGGVAGHSHKGLERARDGHCGRVKRRHEVSAVTGACLLMERALYRSLGGMDAANLPVAFNDVDLCLRIEAAGLRVLWSPYAELEHLESASRGPEDNADKIARFEAEIAFMKRRWGPRLAEDPYYNSNLTLDREDFSLAWPPRTVRAWHANWAGSGEIRTGSPRILGDTHAL
jgi:GT2 family glycosyltransferase